MYTVYSLKAPDGRLYVGVTSMELRARWNNGNGYRFCSELWEQIQKYGWDSVRKEIHAENLTKDDASLLEKTLIRKFDSTNPEHGFNRELGGLLNEKVISSATREKHSRSVTGEKNHNYGKHFSEEHRRKISESNQGQRRSPETCARIGKSHAKPVDQFTTTGMLIAHWASGKQAAAETGVFPQGISKVCKGLQETAGGFVWRFA